jgi:hypothetical protein
VADEIQRFVATQSARANQFVWINRVHGDVPHAFGPHVAKLLGRADVNDLNGSLPLDREKLLNGD